jgi:cell division protein FtsN
LNYPDNTGLVLFLAFLSLAFVLPGLYANAIYYTFCNRNISAALQATPDIPSACKALAEQAPTPKRWLKIAMVNVVLLALLAGVANFFLNPPSGLAVLTEAQKSRPSVGVVTDAPPAAPAPEPAPATPVAIPPTTPAPTQPVTPPATAPTTAPITPPATTSPATTPPTSSAPAAATETKPASEPQKPASNAKVPVVRPARQEPVTPAQPPASAALSPWYVQAGAYSREDSAQTVRTRLELAGLTASTEAIDTPAGRLIRVRAGPFSNKAQADQAVVKIKALELPAVLFRD